MVSLRKSINAMCRECIYDSNGGGGTWRQQVEACTSPKCPLFAVRPVSATYVAGGSLKSPTDQQSGQNDGIRDDDGGDE